MHDAPLADALLREYGLVLPPSGPGRPTVPSAATETTTRTGSEEPAQGRATTGQVWLAPWARHERPPCPLDAPRARAEDPVPAGPSADPVDPPAASAEPAALPAGWYTDPVDAGLIRWWDGTGWSADTASAPPAAPPADAVVTAPVVEPAEALAETASPSPDPSHATVAEPADAASVAEPLPEGWYADPADSAQIRWWDGESWGQDTAPAPEAPVAPGAEESPADIAAGERDDDTAALPVTVPPLETAAATDRPPVVPIVTTVAAGGTVLAFAPAAWAAGLAPLVPLARPAVAAPALPAGPKPPPVWTRWWFWLLVAGIAACAYLAWQSTQGPDAPSAPTTSVIPGANPNDGNNPNTAPSVPAGTYPTPTPSSVDGYTYNVG